MGFKSSVADPDVWMRPATKSDGEEYYEYLLAYVLKSLSISSNSLSMQVRNELSNRSKETLVAGVCPLKTGPSGMPQAVIAISTVKAGICAAIVLCIRV